MSQSPYEAAWNEARGQLAAAERALAASDPAQAGAAIAHTEAAITLLDRIVTATSHAAPRRLLAAAWSLRALAHERIGTPAQLNDAIRAGEKAVAQLRATTDDADLQVRVDLAVALHQEANLRQQRNAEGDRRAAINRYDEAITTVRALPLESAPGLRHLCGVIWLNRGAACVRGDQREDAEDALRSFDEAIAAWRSLPDQARPELRANLAAALMNRAHSALRLGLDPVIARTAADEALALIADTERVHAAAADVALKARHTICRAIGQQLAAAQPAPSELLAAATDAVDDGLALARHWVQQKSPVPLAFVADLFRFGAQTYLAHQPHFLAEFVLDNLDPDTAEDALPWHPALHAIAEEAVVRALRDLERPQIVTIDAPGAERRIQSLHDLRHAAERLAALRARATPAPPAST